MRLGQQPAVQIEPHGVHEPALLRAEQVPRAPDLQILHRDLEAGAEVRGLEDGAQALLRRLGQAPVRVVEQVGVGLVPAAPHAAAELVELGQAEIAGFIDDDGVHVGDVQPVLDDRAADQHVVRALAELHHHSLQRVFIHLPVGHRHVHLRHEPAQPGRGALDRLHPVVDEVDLPPAVHLPQDRLPHQVVVVAGDVRLDR
jgi:hypothetical protein